MITGHTSYYQDKILNLAIKTLHARDCVMFGVPRGQESQVALQLGNEDARSVAVLLQ